MVSLVRVCFDTVVSLVRVCFVSLRSIALCELVVGYQLEQQSLHVLDDESDIVV